MDIILTYQYELLYFFGAVCAFFSMLSYVALVVQSMITRGATSMDSSDSFFEGFDGPDLATIMSGVDEGGEYTEDQDFEGDVHGLRPVTTTDEEACEVERIPYKIIEIKEKIVREGAREEVREVKRPAQQDNILVMRREVETDGIDEVLSLSKKTGGFSDD